MRERIEALGFDGGKTIVDDFLRDIAAGTLRADLAAGDVILAPRITTVGGVVASSQISGSIRSVRGAPSVLRPW